MIASLLLVACALQGPAPGGPGGPGANGGRAPYLARGADGAVHLSWIEEDEQGARLFLSTRREDDWGAPREIAAGADWFVNWADFPAVSALRDGTLVAHWLEKLDAGTYAYGIRIVLSRDGGGTWSEPEWLHDDLSPVEHGFASFVPLDEETFGVVWLDGRGGAGHGRGATALYFRTVSSEGDLGPETVLDERVCDCCPTSLVRTEDGVLYAAYRDRSEDEVRDIAFVRHDGVWSAPRSVHADGWKIPGCPVNGPRLAVAKDEVAVAWYTGADEAAGRVLVAFLEGEGFGTPVQVDDGAPLGRVDLVAAGPERWLVAWLEHGGESAQWRTRSVRRDGETFDSRALGDVDSGRASGHLRMARSSRGSTWITFADRNGVTLRRSGGGH